MPLQSSRLTCKTLVTFGNQPPDSLQPALTDGIHLRWSFNGQVGFPWHGYYLFRRRHIPGARECFRKLIPELPPGPLPSRTLETPRGRFVSDRALVLTDDFDPARSPELDLDERSYLAFVLPAEEPAREIQAIIGFRGARGGRQVCFDLQPGNAGGGRSSLAEERRWRPEMVSGEVPTLHLLRARSLDRRGRWSSARIVSRGGDWGADCGKCGVFTLPRPSGEVRVDLTWEGEPPVVEALDADGSVVDRQTVIAGAGRGQVRLRGAAIRELRVHPTGVLVLVRRVCLILGDTVAGEQEVSIFGYSDGLRVTSATARGRPGEVVEVSIEADMMTHVVLTPAAAALVDICVTWVSTGLREDWSVVPDTPCPVFLPVAQAGYPGRQSERAAAMEEALSRIRYGPAEVWGGTRFEDLHSVIASLVDGGPEAGSMSTRSSEVVSSDGTVRMPAQRPLEMLLLASVHPAVAQMLGLYIVDTTAKPGLAYDYLLIADHTNQFEGECARALGAVRSGTIDFAAADGFVVFNRRAIADAELPAPSGGTAHALPSAARVIDSQATSGGNNNAGLRWDLGRAAPSWNPAGEPVSFFVWRARHDAVSAATGPRSDLPDSVFQPITDHPILVTERLNEGELRFPSDWPPYQLHYIDAGISDGWYSYRVTGVDIFGRHSPRSASFRWRTWDPPPVPQPWYWGDLEAGRIEAAAFAVQLLDRTPPPPPTGIEAWALDPDDPTVVRDAAFSAWREARSDLAETIGLRVRWRWPQSHRDQAPDTREFRVYLHPGRPTEADPDAMSSPSAWAQRIAVVGLNENRTVAGPDWRYEIFLPQQPGAPFTGLDLSTSLSDPVAYAQVTVTAADDKLYAPDDPRRSDAWYGNRPGNESVVGTAATVFVVRRTPPPAPAPPSQPERVYATAADYHGQSRYSFRWRAHPQLSVCIYRTVDAALFAIDAEHQPRASLDLEDEAVFPVTDPAWPVERRRLAADELARLATATDRDSAYAALSDDALRILAALPGNELAFVELTTQPIASDSAEHVNRRGPEEPPDVIVSEDLRIFIDSVDGRSRNRYLYRAAYVDKAHNRSPLGPAGAPVYIPETRPPRAPSLTRAYAGTTEADNPGDGCITLQWAAPHPDVAEIIVLRAEQRQDASHPRLMSERVRLDTTTVRVFTDTECRAGVTYFYRLRAVDSRGNVSPPTRAVAVRAFDARRPRPPSWNPAELDSESGGLRLSWSVEAEGVRSLVQRRVSTADAWENLTGWLPTGTYTIIDRDRITGVEYSYRVRVMDQVGRTNAEWRVLTV